MVQASEAAALMSSSDSHAEQVFYNLHYRACMFYLRHTSRMVRMFFELFWMVLAIFGFAALICLHLAFVYRGGPVSSSKINQHYHHTPRSIPSTCLPSVPGFRRDADVTHLVLLEEHGVDSFAWEIGRDVSFLKNETMECLSDDVSTCSSYRLPAALTSGKVHFSFSKTKGFAFLTPTLSSSPPTTTELGISTQIVAISKTDTRCFGEDFLQQVVFRLLGPDLVMTNWLLAISNGTGFIYNPRKDKIVDLGQYPITNNVRNYSHNRVGGFGFAANSILSFSQWRTWFRPWTSKFRTAMKTCVIYFISTNLVSFLLRVAQERLLELSIQIRSHQQESRSIIPLFVTHVADCFIFIPIFVGVLFYLREFYQGDWVIALTFLAIVFICELFSCFSVRTAQGIFFFPRAFFLLFCLVHFYLFSFPFGFSYVAMGMIVCFMLQCTTFFWNRYEVPAVVLGLGANNPRNSVHVHYSEHDAIVPRDSLSRHRMVTNQFAASDGASALNNGRPSPARREASGLSDTPDVTEPAIRVSLQPQYQQRQQPQIHYTYSQGAFSQGLLSRASSEAIFHASADADDESESCLYFLGGEVVIRRRGNSGSTQSGGSVGDSAQMNRYDSTSTLQSAAQLGGVTDESAASGLQAIHDLTPRLCNLSGRPETVEGANTGGPVMPVLESSRPRAR